MDHKEFDKHICAVCCYSDTSCFDGDCPYIRRDKSTK